jgi:hypothetical protein
MLEIIFDKELDVIDISPIILTPLSQLLLRQRNYIVIIAKFINYPHNNQINLSSVRIITQMSKREDAKLVDIFLESKEDLAIIAGYVDKLESEENIQSIIQDKSSNLFDILSDNNIKQQLLAEENNHK